MAKITLKRKPKSGRKQVPSIDLLRGRLPQLETKARRKVARRKKLALIIPAHNEALLLAGTIQSAIEAGLSRRDIYVVDDASTDATAAIAKRLLGAHNVLTVEHSGKLGAVQQAFEYFRIQKRYVWVHITDGDGLFGPDYFHVFKRRLNGKYVAATGHLQSLKGGGWVAQYRTYEYTIGLEIMRRLQHWLGVITVIPGPTSCFRTDIFAQLDFHDSSLTEDFDATLQIHRRRLGKIGFFPDAKAFTQDPRNFHDFYVQVSRWYRGFWQGVRKYRVGLHPRKIDLYVNWLVLETLLQTVQIGLLLALALLSSRGPQILSFYFVLDLTMTFIWVLFAAIVNRRWDIITALPYFYILRFATLFIFFKAAFEVMVLNKFKTVKPGWETAGRRYRIQTGQS